MSRNGVVCWTVCFIYGVITFLMGCPHSQWRSMGGICYLLFKAPVSWSEAEQACHSLNSYLAFPKTAAEITNVYTYINQNGVGSVWVGVNDLTTEGQFVCQDGSLLSSSYWMPGNPDNHTEAEDCIEMWYQEGFNDAECWWPKDYVCQVKDHREKFSMQSTSCVDESVLPAINDTTPIECGVWCLQHTECCAFYYDRLNGACELSLMKGPEISPQYQTQIFQTC